MVAHVFKRSAYDSYVHIKFVDGSPSTDGDFEFMTRVPYFGVVGSLMYVMVCSRSDLSFAMSQ